jgi:hypothetical protein
MSQTRTVYSPAGERTASVGAYYVNAGPSAYGSVSLQRRDSEGHPVKETSTRFVLSPNGLVYDKKFPKLPGVKPGANDVNKGYMSNKFYTMLIKRPIPVNKGLPKLWDIVKPPIKVVTKPVVPPAPSEPPTPVIIEPNSSYKWNLPPHTWSLPLDPGSVNSEYSKVKVNSHGSRRGKIFFGQGYVGPDVQVTGNSNDKTLNVKGGNAGKASYGFQFMWNPESFSQSTSVNMNVTPSETDATSGLTGFVAANSTIRFTLRLDRTNDFAHFKANNFGYGVAFATAAEALATVDADVSSFHRYYFAGGPVNSEVDFGANVSHKIIELQKYGTAADLEYLYRSINGDGFNKLGQDTSEIGYLRPTLVRLDLGPQKYLGIVSSIDVSHLAFTRDMIPIRTDVAISIDLRAGTGYTTSGVAGSTVPQGATTP